jgi:membrane protease YdiL (CAAX protease family)
VVQPPRLADRKAVASRKHLIGFLIILLMIAVLPAVRHHLKSYHPLANGPSTGVRSTGSVIRGEFIGIAVEWAIVGYIYLGIRKTGGRLSDLAGRQWAGVMEVFKDVGIAAGSVTACLLLRVAIGKLIGLPHAQLSASATPRNIIELMGWIAISVTAGITEELMFRGYLQRQFVALSGNLPLSLVSQALIFGAVHSSQGWGGMVSAACLGGTFGVLAYWRQNLRPGIVAHFGVDALGGFLRLLKSLGILHLRAR